MPTIDQLAPATAAADTDQILVSQSGTTRKISRAQILAGVQPILAVPAGTLLGRVSGGIGAPETITIGGNLSLAGTTLMAVPATFTVSKQPTGTVPVATDLIPLAQNGTNAAVSYAQFLSGLPGVANINASQAVVVPTGGINAIKLSDLAANMMPMTGGTLTGPLLLSGSPTVATQAATKAYVDTQTVVLLPKTGGSLTGGLTLAADPAMPLQSATKQYVDMRVSRSGDTLTGPLILASDPVVSQQAATKAYVDTLVVSCFPKSGGTLTGILTLAGDPAAALQASTKQYVDNRVLRNGDTLTGSLILASDPVTPPQAATKNYVDTQLTAAVPKSGGTLTGALTLAGDPVAALQAATRQYVDNRVLRNGDTLTGPLALSADPVVPTQAATKNYVDVQSLAKAGGVMTGALILAADPVAPLQPATKRYVDAQTASMLPLVGGTLTGPLALANNPSAPTQAANKQYVDSQVAASLPLIGGSLTGPLTLAANPTTALGAATKQYVDSASVATGAINVKAAPYNALLNGVTDDTAAFKAAYVAAPAGSTIYVPFGVTVLQNPSSWGVSLTKRVKWVIDGTTLANGASLTSSIPAGTVPAALTLPGVVVGNTAQGAEASLAGSSATDLAVQHVSYIVNHNGGTTGAVSANSRCDTIIYNSPGNFIWGGVDRLVWNGVQTPTGSAPAQHVGRYIQTIRQTIGTNASGVPLPQPQLWAACLEMRDTTGQPSSSSNATLAVEMDFIGNGLDDAGNRQIQSLVVQQNNTSGAPVEVSTIIGVYLAAGSSGRTKKVLAVGIPFSQSVLDTTYAVQLPGAAAIRLAAGHAIAFEPSGSNYLAFDNASGILRWNQGSLSYPVGKGITVGWQYVAGGNTSLPGYIAGDMVFLVGSGTYTVTLPAANTVPAGVGFTFSNIGTAAVTIAPTGTDSIDNGPVVLRQHDRYHIVSDNSGTWREIFRTNAVSPRFTGPPILPSYSVASLPVSPGAGAKAFVTNGRKPSEGAGAGSGVEVFHDGTRWISVCAGTQVSA